MSPGLRYHPCVEQRALADTFNASLAGLLPLDRLHGSQGESDATWSQLQDIGLFTMAVDEDRGGSGLGCAEEALIVMELGRRLAAPSVFATLAAVHARPASGDVGASPDARAAAAYRRDARTLVIGDCRAEMVLLRDGDDAQLEHMPGGLETLDDELWGARLQTGSSGAAIAHFDAAGLRHLRLIDSAALAGIAETALTMAVGYAGERRQFGRPIGSFQAIKHHCANMAIAARNARDQVSFASVAMDEERADAAFQVDCALYVAAGAAMRNTATNIQVHGGIGFSEEALPHLLLKRAQVLLAVAGGMEAANRRIGDGAGSRTASRGPAEASHG